MLRPEVADAEATASTGEAGGDVRGDDSESRASGPVGLVSVSSVSVSARVKVRVRG